ncbi:PREDICTED: uncharacterized protein LOC107063621 [Polistes dominula]|uniref:Uncharacterized protein LOC107063621 n=1 Tax=Polistes dominula TaxID=743375 RepID=A0ABM1HSS7_POLDO|nr:PREDICTED: uncharacterized protein LOC107063621 [Polistes dominula]
MISVEICTGRSIKQIFVSNVLLSVNEIWERFEVITGASKENFYVIQNGRTIGKNDKLLDGRATIVPKLFGGKGGFGSMLRAIGAQIEKTTNREACRDLSGRRLRDINEEKRLKSWIEKQAEHKKEAAERRKKKLERLCAEPKYEFKDQNYEKRRSTVSEMIEEAVEEGFKCVAADSSTMKRKREEEEVKSNKKKNIFYLDIDSDELDTTTDDDSDVEDCTPSTSTSDQQISSNRLSIEETDNDNDKLKQTKVSDSIASETVNAQIDNSVENSKDKIKDTENVNGHTDISNHLNWSLLDHDKCGNSNADRIIGGKNASMGAYPWIARIGYSISKSNLVNIKQLVYKCGGSLINKYHVLTAAHCVTNLPNWLTIVSIRLGEHNTLTDPDCEEEFCAEPVQDFQIAFINVHEDYDRPRFRNDIAIIRLDKPAVYNEFVIPICMPHGNLLEKNYIGEMAIVAGWGINDIETLRSSKLLQTVMMPIQDTEKCIESYKNRAKISDQQICVGGIIGEDSCNGDSGGPLMKVETVDELPKYYLIGIVSFGVKECGNTTSPGVYTRVSRYINWILNNIKLFNKDPILRMYLFVTVITILYLSTYNIGDAQSFDCTTPNGVAGSCINIRQCIPLIKLLQNRPLLPESENYLRQSQCGFEGQNPRVCCPAGSNQIDLPSSRDNIPSTDNPLETGNKAELIDNLLNNPLLPSECGKDLIFRIIGGTPTALEEFPWMALLEYQHPRGHTTACGGVLISKRYVLTAAHCLKGKDLPSTWSLRNVRLGEYDTSSEQDCITSNDVVICSDDPITVGIEEQIVHEQYNPRSRDQKYDIAMLRLSRDINSTNYIKPICLPRSESLDGQLFVAGWGTTEFNSSSNIKLKLSLPLAEKDNCARTYNQVNIKLGYGQICAGGTKGKDSCRGDSGGPLVTRIPTLGGAELWTTVGVVSFGPTPCGLQGWPGVYTKVYDYVPWIVGNLKP